MLESSFQVLDDFTEKVKSSLMLELTSSLANIKTKRKFFAQKQFFVLFDPNFFLKREYLNNHSHLLQMLNGPKKVPS